VFHIQLHERSNKLSRLNLSERELMLAVLDRWVRGEKVEIGEILWSPDEAQITVVEGPEVPIGGMTLGRGWPTAVRQGRQVTEEVFAKARMRMAEAEAMRASAAEAAGETQPAGAGSAAADLALLADSLGLELLRRLGEGEMPLQSAWRLAAERHPQMSPSGTLEVATAAITSLAQSDLVSVIRAAGGDSLPPQELAPALADVASWSSGESAQALMIRRA